NYPDGGVRLASYMALCLNDVERPNSPELEIINSFIAKLPRGLGYAARWAQRNLAEPEGTERLRRGLEGGGWIAPCAPLIALIALLRDVPQGVTAAIDDEPNGILRFVLLVATILFVALYPSPPPQYQEALTRALSGENHLPSDALAAALAAALGVLRG